MREACAGWCFRIRESTRLGAMGQDRARSLGRGAGPGRRRAWAWLVPALLSAFLLIPVGRASVSKGSGKGTLLHFSIHVTTRIHSRIRVDLQASGRAGSPVVAQGLANRTLVWAVDTIHHRGGTWLRFHTGGLSSRPVAWAHGRITEWEATAVLTLESANGKKMGALLARLEKRLVVSDVRYQPAGSAGIHHALMLRGLHELAGLARQACTALGDTRVHLLDIRIAPLGRTSRPRPLPMFAGVAQPASAVPALHHSLRVKLALAARIRCSGVRHSPNDPSKGKRRVGR